MQSLFPQQQASLPGSGGGRNGGTTLIQFKAGRCNMAEIPHAGGKMKITPQKQKGWHKFFVTSYVITNHDESLLLFQT